MYPPTPDHFRRRVTVSGNERAKKCCREGGKEEKNQKEREITRFPFVYISIYFPVYVLTFLFTHLCNLAVFLLSLSVDVQPLFE